MRKLSACILILAIVFGTHSQSDDCQKFVQELIQNIMKLNITSIPLPSIMYSGITTNNPGQFYQCQSSNFSYYLVTIKNTTTNINSFTGICVPKICSRQDMQIALQFWNCKVYDYPSQVQHDGLAVAGIVILSLWVSILTIWSIVLSCKEPQINEYIKKEKEQNSANSLVQSGKEVQDNRNMHVFNFYQGYCKIFKQPKRKSLMGSFLFWAVFSVLVSTQFSYKQTLASNPGKAYNLFNSGFGVFVTNTQIAFSVIVFILGMRLAYGVYKLNTFHQFGRYYFDQLLKKWVFLLLISLSLYGLASYIDQPLSKYWQLNYGKDCPSCLWQTWFLFRNLLLDTKICMPWLWLLQAEIFLTLLSTPFVIIFRVKKMLGYALMTLVVVVSSIVGYAILDDLGIVFEPTKLFNQQKQYVIDYQTNTIVRAAPFFLGLMLGFFIIQGLQKVQGKPRNAQYKLAKKVRRQPCIQYTLQIIGLVFMIFTFSMIAAFLTIPQKNADQTNAYIFITYGSLLFVIGLFLFVLPSFWQGQSWLSTFINDVFGWSGWTQFQKLSICLFVVGPMVMGFTTYCIQNNIYYDYETIIVYLIGDMTLVYIICILAASAIQNQITFIFNWIQTKTFGRQNKYSILLLEE